MEASDAEVVVAKVVGGQMEEGRVKGVELEGGRVLPCDVAVLCMGPWTGGVHTKCLLFHTTIPRTGTGLVGAPWHWHWGEQSPQVEPGRQNMLTEEQKSQCDLSAAP